MALGVDHHVREIYAGRVGEQAAVTANDRVLKEARSFMINAARSLNRA
jgi:hypothetical protein